MQDSKPFRTGERLCQHAHCLEIGEYVRFDTFELLLCVFEGLFLNAERDIFSLDKTVVSFGELIFQHFRVLAANVVEIIVLRLYFKLLHKLLGISDLIQKRELHLYSAVEIIEEIAVILKDRGLVLVLRKLIVYIEKLYRFRVQPVSDLADTVTVHLLETDSLLCRMGCLSVPVGASLLNGGSYRFFLLSCNLIYLH